MVRVRGWGRSRLRAPALLRMRNGTEAPDGPRPGRNYHMTIERALPDEDLVVDACPRCFGRVFQPWTDWEPYCLNCGWQDYPTRDAAHFLGHDALPAQKSPRAA